MATSRQSKATNITQEEAKLKSARTNASFKRLFLTEDGKIVIEDLRALFDRPTALKDAHAMIVSAAMRSVVDYIMMRMEAEE